MSVDLHIHTTASDGLVAPADIVRSALDLGLSVIAITDHDSIEGVAEARSAAAGTTLEIVPGVELSVTGPAGEDVHVLGFFLDETSPELALGLAELREARRERARLMVERLRASGHAIDFESVLDQAGRGAIGRVHVARALVEGRSVDTIEQAFAQLIGRRAPFYVHKRTFEALEGLQLIHGAGGVAVLAHPGVSGEGALVPLVQAGLDGVEVFHADHTVAQRQHFASVAERFGLLATGGSDFHGLGMHSAALGAGGCPDSAVEALRKRATVVRS